MKIGIFTGTFDPFTIGHQNIAERAFADVRQARDCSRGEQTEARQRGNLEACGGYQGCFPEGMFGVGGCGRCI